MSMCAPPPPPHLSSLLPTVLLSSPSLPSPSSPSSDFKLSEDSHYTCRWFCPLDRFQVLTDPDYVTDVWDLVVNDKPQTKPTGCTFQCMLRCALCICVMCVLCVCSMCVLCVSATCMCMCYVCAMCVCSPIHMVHAVWC